MMIKTKWLLITIVLASTSLLQGCYVEPPHHHTTVVVKKPHRHYHPHIGYHRHKHKHHRHHHHGKRVIVKPNKTVIIRR